MHNNLMITCKKLGIFHALFASKGFWSYFWQGENKKTEKEIKDIAEEGLYHIMSDLNLNIYLDFDIKERDINIDYPISNTIEWLMETDISLNLIERFGSKYGFIYKLSLLTVLNSTISDLLIKIEEENKNYNMEVPDYVKKECNMSEESIRIYTSYLEDNKSFIKIYMSNIINYCNNIIKAKEIENDLERHVTMKKNFNEIINILYPNFSETTFKLENGYKLINKLDQCKPGKKDWKNYENLIKKVINFLFVPPFKKIITQSSTKENDSIRDIILPNNNFEGFWKLIRDEFNSKHIVCELKNYNNKVTKNELNQLRLYLRKKTIGKFGLLFIRNQPSKSLLTAQKRAYEEDGILILIINDELIKEMIKKRIFIDSPVSILENLKIKFELDY